MGVMSSSYEALDCYVKRLRCLETPVLHCLYELSLVKCKNSFSGQNLYEACDVSDYTVYIKSSVECPNLKRKDENTLVCKSKFWGPFIAKLRVFLINCFAL